MYEESVGCWVGRYALEGKMGRLLTDAEWELVLASIDSDAVEDAIVDLVREVLAKGGLMHVASEGGRNA